jgi:hypothetical protein
MSNVGIAQMPEHVRDYVEKIDVFNSTDTLQVCFCTFMDKLAVTFSSAFVSTEIQKNFFRSLTSRGVSVEVISNTI